MTHDRLGFRCRTPIGTGSPHASPTMPPRLCISTLGNPVFLLVGSPNLDPRSGKLNTEIGILFESEPLANGLADWFDDNQAHIAYRVSLDRSQFTTNPRVSSDVIQLLRYGKKASDPGRALIKVASIVWKFPRIEK